MRVCVFRYRHPRSKRMADALEDGVRRMGWKLTATDQPSVVDSCEADVLAAYGWVNQPMFDRYLASGRQFIYIDLGYWSRKNGAGDYSGFHKCVVDARHATEYFQRFKRPADRIEDAPPIRDWQLGGDHIVLAGLSAKSAESYGYHPYEWERLRINAIRSATNMEIVFRPKPSWKEAAPLMGTRFSGPTEKIEHVLQGAYGLVTLHSNAAIDALAYGVPFYAEDGLAKAVSPESIAELISAPRRDIDRKQFLADVGYCHWTRHEMADGSMFAQFLADGLIR